MIESQAQEASRKHALQCYPEESCGAITNNGYIPFKNVAEKPTEQFDCFKEGTELSRTIPIIALVHSHPVSSKDLLEGRYGPSRGDMQQQIIMDIPWGIVPTDGSTALQPFFWSDDLCPPPLEKRQFRHGPSGTDGRGDCYALIRDWYKLNKGITIPEIPRDDSWWTENIGQNLYADNFTMAGFELGDRKFPEIGDVALAEVVSRSGVPNHGAIYVGNGLILHHLPGRYSRIEPVINWMKHITTWLHYRG